MTVTPYTGRPKYCFWKASVASLGSEAVDPAVGFPFTITMTDKIATAGSCFAQHLARHLKGAGFNYFVTEPGHALLSEPVKEKFQYGLFSARYGNIYTTRQLLQTLERAYGKFHPSLNVWQSGERVVDPFRPNVQPQGFASEEELFRDRDQHFAAIRQMVEETDYFVFTLGLTEGWWYRKDGAALPLAPGVIAGVYDAELYEFRNLSVSDIVSDMNAVINFFRARNPGVKFILTVSPVPLAATMEEKHVLVSTTSSKARLRAACDEIVDRHEGVAYFPSYEIITGNFNRGAYYESDLRSVTDSGVQHVMACFLRNATDFSSAEANTPVESTQTAEVIERYFTEICEEAMLDVS